MMPLHPAERRIYTVGTIGWRAADLLLTVRMADALLVDIRHNPRDASRPWSQADLVALVGSTRYRSLEALAAHYYRPGRIALAGSDVDASVARAADWLADQSIILLCACADWRTCHRRQAADLIAAATGIPVAHL